jgi:hypothetical protein
LKFGEIQDQEKKKGGKKNEEKKKKKEKKQFKFFVYLIYEVGCNVLLNFIFN